MSQSRKRELLPERRVITDASSIILLQKSFLLPDFLKHYSAVVPEAVYQELTSSDKDGAAELGDLLKIYVENGAETPSINSMGQGESGALSLFEKGRGDFVLVDDKKAAKHCKNKKIPFVNSLLLSRILFLAGRISRENYLSGRKVLIEQGYYSEEIIQRARFIAVEELTHFFP